MIRQPYIGPDLQGRQISGVILCSGPCGSGPIPPYYTVATEPNGHEAGIALVPGEVIHEHLTNLDLVESMEADRE